MPRAAAALAAAALLAGLTAPQVFAAPAAPADPDPVPATVAGEGTKAPRLVTGLAEDAGGGNAESAARRHLAANSGRYHVSTKAADLKALPHTGTTVRFQQYHQGVAVLGAQYLVHLQAQGADRDVTGAGGTYFTDLTVDTTPTLDPKASKGRALATVTDPRARKAATAEEHGLVVLPGGVGSAGKSGSLTRHYTVTHTDVNSGEEQTREVYVDAHTGAVTLQHTSQMHAETPATGTGVDVHGTTQPINVAKQDDGTYRLSDLTNPTRIDTYDAEGRPSGQFNGRMPAGMKPMPNPTADYPAAAGETGAVNAHINSAKVYDFYKKKFGREGIDGKGGTILSVVNVRSSSGKPYLNAFWDGTKMVYGGGGPDYYSFAAAMDVAGHEMTHGVITNSANLIYINQSGSINEGLADYFGNAIEADAKGTPSTDPNAGLVGEDLCRKGTPKECALRDLNDGRSAVKDYIGLPVNVDNGGVHYNSTIFAGALWDIREQLSATTADKLVYKALTEYMTPLDDFADGRDAILAAGKASKLSKADLRKVARAFDQHGIFRGWEKKTGTDSEALVKNVTDQNSIPAAEGGRYVVSNSDPTGDSLPGLYAGRTDGGGKPKRLTPDDGRWYVYPATDGKKFAAMAMSIKDNAIDTMDVVTGSVKGGPLTTLFSSKTEQTTEIKMDGDHIAVLTTDFSAGESFLYTSYKGSPLKRVETIPADHGVWALTVKDGKLGYTEYWTAAKGTLFVPTVTDMLTGKVVKQFLPADQTGATSPLINGTTLVKGKLVWASKGRAAGAKTAIQAGSLSGAGTVTDVVPATSPDAPATAQLTASDRYVTYADLGGVEADNAKLPKLKQVSLNRPGTAVRVSCNRGMQWYPDADGDGRQVVWIDGTAGATDIVTRFAPTHRTCK
ncbi:M4 family metallopeptidase [Streptomyces sp. NPDC087440]|uniref:M4 family metallopeptidase n=1 Tax=Streptomyces sp. NPDC087440 TaxID=3365790 RepID=UPI0037F5E353